MSHREKTRKQRQQRRGQFVRRIEIVLHSDDPRDHEIFSHLDTLGRGEMSEFIRAAVYEKITRTAHQPAPVPSASAEFNAILAELAALREAVSQPARLPELAEVTHERRARMQTSAAPALPEAAPVITSGGIDMSRPRRAATRAPTPPPTLPEIEPPFDPEASARLLVQSIKGYGQDRR